jgi:hypothetical protein
MKPGIAEARKAQAAEALAATMADLKVQMDRIEAKLDALLSKNGKATKSANADEPTK